MNTEQKPYLRSAENTVSFYEVAEMVFAQLKNNSGLWSSVEQLCENYAWLWTDQTEAYDHAHFAGWILNKALKIRPYTRYSAITTTQYYSEFQKALNIQLEGDVTPFLIRLGVLIRREVISKRWNKLMDFFEGGRLEEKNVSEASHNKERDLVMEIDRLQKIISKLEVVAVLR